MSWLVFGYSTKGKEWNLWMLILGRDLERQIRMEWKGHVNFSWRNCFEALNKSKHNSQTPMNGVVEGSANWITRIAKVEMLSAERFFAIAQLFWPHSVLLKALTTRIVKHSNYAERRNLWTGNKQEIILYDGMVMHKLMLNWPGTISVIVESTQLGHIYLGEEWRG